MTTRKRLIIYGGTAVVSELAAVTLALVANLTRQFDNGPLHSLSTLFAALGMLALGGLLELVRPKRTK